MAAEPDPIVSVPAAGSPQSPPPPSAVLAPAPPPRLLSIDALRGFDMFWIVGGEGIALALDKAFPGRVGSFFTSQLTHKDWAGFAFYDLIFPMFVFLVGVSIVFSVPRMKEKLGRGAAFRRILVRSLLLVALGVLYSGGIGRGWAEVRWVGVLQRIGISYFVTATLFLFLKPRALAGLLAVLLAGYWAILTFIPVRDISLERGQIAALQARTGERDPQVLFDRTTTWVRPSYDAGKNVSDHFDFQHLPGRKYDGLYDPEGIVSALGGVATCLFGVLAGLLLAQRRRSDLGKARLLMVMGLAAVGLGFLWGLQLPVVKKIWTPSFVLVAGGYSCLLLGAFHMVIEGWKVRRWALPFLWIGSNALTIYLADRFIGFESMAERIAGGPVKGALGIYGDLLVTMVAMALAFALVRFLYNRRIFLRL